MELVDRTFYQVSRDGALVAIIADYPGLLPASHVSKPESQLPRRIPSLRLPTAHVLRLTGKAIGAPYQTRGDSPTRGTEAG